MFVSERTKLWLRYQTFKSKYQSVSVGLIQQQKRKQPTHDKLFSRNLVCYSADNCPFMFPSYSNS